MKKTFCRAAIVLIGMMLLALPLFAGGSDGGNGGAAKPTVRIVSYDDSDGTYTAELYQFQRMAEEGGAVFDFLAITGADFEVKRNAWLASGDMPDIWQDRVGPVKDMIDTYGPKGMFLPVSDHYDKLPNMQKFISKYPSYSEVTKSPDGKAYGIAHIRDWVPFSSAPSIREFMLNEKGIDPREDIQTLDDLTDALKVLKKYDQDTKGEDNYPWVSRREGGFVGSVAPMFGVGQKVFYEDAAGKYNFGPLHPRFKTMMEYLAKSYADGLIHPDILAMPDQVFEGYCRQMKGHFWIDNIWNGYFWGDDYEGGFPMSKKGFKPILPPKVDGKRYYASRAGNSVNVDQQWIISARTKVLDNVLKMVNWGFSEDGIFTMAMGKEDVTYIVNEDGLRVWPAPGYFTQSRATKPDTGEVKDFADEMTKTAEEWQAWTPAEPWVKITDQPRTWRVFRSFGNFVYPVEMAVPTAYDAAPVSIADKKMLVAAGVVADPAPQLNFTAAELDRRKVLQTPIETYSDEIVSRMLLGEEPLANFDQFIARLKEMGVEELIQIYNTALGRL